MIIRSDQNNRDFLRAEHLSKSFYTKLQTIQVLKDINFEIKKGEFVIVFGPSGCGKSTLLNSLLGLEAPTAGKVIIKGRSIYQLAPDERAEFRKRNMGMVYQQPNWVKSLNVLENVSLPLVLMGVAKQKAMRVGWRMLAQIGLSDKASYFASELSAGQQQKVGFARAMISDPEIVIADEPTGNLDYKAGDGVMDLLSDSHKQGKTIIMVTHDMQYLQYAQRILRMFDGKIIDDIKIEEGMDKEAIKELVTAEHEIPLDNQNQVPSLNNEKSGDKYIDEELSTGGLLANIRRVSIRSLKVIGSLFAYSFYQVATNMGYHINKSTSLKLNSKITKKISGDTVTHNGRSALREVDLIDLAVRNLKLREIRTLVTIGGISLGIGFIVFLLSVGYGFENLVVMQVAGLDERRQLDVLPAESVGLFIDDEKLADFEKLEHVEAVYPVINAVANVEFEGSNFETVTVGTKPEYLSVLDNQVVAGRTIKSNDIKQEVENDTAESEVVEELPLTGTREAVVSTALLKFLGIGSDGILSKNMNLSLTMSSKLVDDLQKIETEAISYSVVGVIDDDENMLIYINLDDLQALGIRKYSQTHLSVTSIDEVTWVRSQISSMGFKTFSLLDITSRIQTLFASLRQILLVMGLFAFSIASLGMFNTLTVSLLERTREIGLMKSMGMKSNEIFDLFLAESLSMSLLGGIMGIVLGFIFGKALSLILTFASMSNGIDYIEVSIIPFPLIITILILSAVIGTLTGFYPSYRATKISALNALRYE